MCFLSHTCKPVFCWSTQFYTVQCAAGQHNFLHSSKNQICSIPVHNVYTAIEHNCALSVSQNVVCVQNRPVYCESEGCVCVLNRPVYCESKGCLCVLNRPVYCESEGALVTGCWLIGICCSCWSKPGEADSSLSSISLPSSRHLSRERRLAFIKKFATVVTSRPNCWAIVACKKDVHLELNDMC